MRALGIVAALCASAAADPIPQIPAPAKLVARPLADGQWVEYRETVQGQPAGKIIFAALQRTECGTTFGVLLENQGRTRVWGFCVADDHTVTNATRDQHIVDARDPELAALVSRVLPPAFTGTFVRDSIGVPAGYFQGALRRDGASTTWLHPAVPLGAVVRVQQGDRVDELARYGDQLATIDAVDQKHRIAAYFEVSIGEGHLASIRKGETGHMRAWALTAGAATSATTDFLFSGAIGDTSEFSASSSTTNETIVLTAGERLTPFRGRFGMAAGLYVQGLVGYARLERPMQLTGNDTGNGLAIVPAIGWQSIRARDWSLGLQASDELMLLDGGVGFHQALKLTVTIDLWLR